ncbi:MAG: IS630 family transposase [Actinomycetota bacterium]|nr:IS630 family transposase [Actinomycetota bacterium]
MAAQKKSKVAQEREEEERDAFGARAGAVDPRRFVSVDECGTHTSMTRSRARAPRGKRAYGEVPRNRGKNTTLIASMTLEGGMGEAMAVEGATDAKVFEAYVEGFLAPSLSTGQIVLLDNLGAHKTAKVRELIEARGAEVWFLPAYSPDLNPIEEAFSKVKALLKKAAARTEEALIEAMARALAAVTPEDARGWFAHSGYGSKDRRL